MVGVTEMEKSDEKKVIRVQGNWDKNRKWSKIPGQAIINCNDFVRFPQ